MVAEQLRRALTNSGTAGCTGSGMWHPPLTGVVPFHSPRTVSLLTTEDTVRAIPTFWAPHPGTLCEKGDEGSITVSSTAPNAVTEDEWRAVSLGSEGTQLKTRLQQVQRLEQCGTQSSADSTTGKLENELLQKKKAGHNDSST